MLRSKHFAQTVKHVGQSQQTMVCRSLLLLSAPFSGSRPRSKKDKGVMHIGYLCTSTNVEVLLLVRNGEKVSAFSFQKFEKKIRYPGCSTHQVSKISLSSNVCRFEAQIFRHKDPHNHCPGVNCWVIY